MPTMYYGHSRNGRSRNGVCEALSDHIRHVSERARSFAAALGCADQGYSTALIHDLGKYSGQFQRRLCDHREKGRDHWTIGAVVAAKAWKELGAIPALCIEGHHVGLGAIEPHDEYIKRISRQFNNDPQRFTTDKVGETLGAFRADGFDIPQFESGLAVRQEYLADMLDTRMLFSALVDADFLETEAHFEGDKDCPRRPRPEGRALDVDRSIASFDAFVEELPKAKTAYAELRHNLLKNCRTAGANSGLGAFTLSAPTGAGKTIAMLGFALEHARKHGLRRVVLAMPFLNIVDQTARIYRQIFSANEFGEDYLLECHSVADDSLERAIQEASGSANEDDVTLQKARRRLLSENWDAPIILTTSVQLLESLFAHKPARCRKLHRLAGSVILFDEVQTLPPKLAVATIGALQRLAGESPYRTSVVFATATQPAFESLSSRIGTLVNRPLFERTPPEWKPTEIVSNADELFAAAKSRVRVTWRHNRPIDFARLSEELRSYHQVLCIVNLKRHAIELAKRLSRSDGNTFHLSTNMCSEHRLHVLDEVKRRLDAKQPLCLITTQCVEAGVDIDFSHVYRALAPLDAIAQAAGRCNRSGLRDRGQVIVFKPAESDAINRDSSLYPPGYYEAVQATQLFLNQLASNVADSDAVPDVINSPALLRQYYKLFYAINGRDTAEVHDERDLMRAIREGNFSDVAKEYRLIEQNVINVVVPYDVQAYRALIVEADTDDMTPRQVRGWIRKARPHSVAIYRPKPTSEIWNQLIPLPLGANSADESDRGITTETHDWWRPAGENCYDELVGLELAESQWVL